MAKPRSLRTGFSSLSFVDGGTQARYFYVKADFMPDPAN